MNPINVRLMILFLLIQLFSAHSFAQEFDKKSLLKISTNDFFQTIDIGNIKMWLSNNGIQSHDFNTGGGMFFWPKNETLSALYSDGFALVGKVKLLNGTTELRAIGGLYRAGLQAGKVLNSGIVQNNIYSPPLSDDPLKSEYRIFKIQKNWNLLRDDDPNKLALQKDYLEWPKNQGAPTDGNGKPLFLGDQTLFYVSNDLSPARASASFGSNSIGLEIQTTIWAYKSFVLQDVIFVQRKFINKSGLQLDSMYFSIYSDPDIGDAADDLAGCDSLIQMIYGYHKGLNPDLVYSYPSPSFGYVFLETPLKPNSTLEDTAIVAKTKIPGKANLGMTAVFGITKHVPDYYDIPIGTSYASPYLFNYSRALTQSGKQQFNSIGQPVKFAFGGDPISRTGDIFDLHYPPHDIRLFGTTGPFTFQPGDTQTIVYAMIIAKGKSNTDGVAQLKELAKTTKHFYANESLLPDSSKEKAEINDNGMVSLSSHLFLPNDFNPDEVKIEFVPTNTGESSIFLNLVKKDNFTNNEWETDTSISSRKFAYWPRYHITVNGKKNVYKKWSTYLILRPHPSVDNIEIIAESGMQDRKYNSQEAVILRAEFTNDDVNNSIDDFMAVYERDYSSTIITSDHFEIPIGQKIKTNDFYFQNIYNTGDDYLPYYSVFDDNVFHGFMKLNSFNYGSDILGDTLHFDIINSDPSTFLLSIADPTLLNGHQYRVDFENINHQINWKLTDKSISQVIKDSIPFSGAYGNPELNANSQNWVFDGILFKTFTREAGKGEWWKPNDWGKSWVNSVYLNSNNLANKYFKTEFIEPENYVPVRIDFAGGDKNSNPDEWSKAYMYTYNSSDSLWSFIGLGDVPFKAWDTENNRQLNICTRNYGDLIWDMGWNGTGFPDQYGNREYIFVMQSSYDENYVYNNILKGPNKDAMYFLWPQRSSSNSKFLSNSFSLILNTNKINKPGEYLEFTAPESKPIAGYKGTPFVILDNNFPNPFNPTTIIHFDLGKDYRNVSLIVYNILGQQIKVLKNEPMLLGSYNIRWDGKNENQNPVSSGIYFYRLVTDGFSQTNKMILLK